MSMRSLLVACATFVSFGIGPADAAAQSDIPAKFVSPVKPDYVKRDEMIPMRDGVKLHTVIVIPNGVKRAPIIFSRTPYSAARSLPTDTSNRLTSLLSPWLADLAAAGYIIVIQDVRGKFGSEGDYVLTRPLVGKWNRTKVDHATDTYDSIEWLVKHVPESNGKIGTMGTSYGGFTTLMSLVHPHPALKAAVPVNPLADGWTGDDWFHNGAFRQTYMDYYYRQMTDRSSAKAWVFDRYDTFETWLKAGTPKAVADAYGLDQLPFWQRVQAHPAYDDYWSDQALDKILAKEPLAVPTLHVHSLWDQEDIYGAPATYAAMEPKDRANDANYLIMGPWNHGQSNGDGSSLGPFKFDGDSGRWYRRNVLLPFLDARLKDGAAPADIAPVTAFETGANVWRRYSSWPQSCAEGCPHRSQPIYLAANNGLSFQAPSAADNAYDEYVSDPAKPVPNRLRPSRPTYATDSTWNRWLVDDQRFAGDRTDVLTYTSEALTETVHVAGQPIARFFASTSGSDSDWVVKLIDVYPDEVPGQADLGSYQWPIAMDILRGRYRDDPAHPTPIPSGEPVAYALKLPQVNHAFLKGHRIMVQIQSSWFPLYDRNPQTYVPNIFNARPEDFRKATQKVYRSGKYMSRIELPVIPGN